MFKNVLIFMSNTIYLTGHLCKYHTIWTKSMIWWVSLKATMIINDTSICKWLERSQFVLTLFYFFSYMKGPGLVWRIEKDFTLPNGVIWKKYLSRRFVMHWIHPLPLGGSWGNIILPYTNCNMSSSSQGSCSN